MKKLTLVNLILALLVKSVSACSQDASKAVDPVKEQAAIAESFFYIKIFFFSLIFLILANFILFFVRKKYDAFVLIALIVITLGTIPFSFMGLLVSDCDGRGLRSILLLELLVFLAIFGAHIALWVKNLEVEWSIANIGDIKLR